MALTDQVSAGTGNDLTVDSLKTRRPVQIAEPDLVKHTINGKPVIKPGKGLINFKFIDQSGKKILVMESTGKTAFISKIEIFLTGGDKVYEYKINGDSAITFINLDRLELGSYDYKVASDSGLYEGTFLINPR